MGGCSGVGVRVCVRAVSRSMWVCVITGCRSVREHLCVCVGKSARACAGCESACASVCRVQGCKRVCARVCRVRECVHECESVCGGAGVCASVRGSVGVCVRVCKGCRSARACAGVVVCRPHQ